MEIGGQRKTERLQHRAELDVRYLMLLRAAGYLLYGALMACARVMDVGAPFGIAAVACAGAGANGVCALLGACTGYLMSGGIEWGVRYLAASVLVYTLAFMFRELDIYKHSLFMPACASLVMMLTGFLSTYSAIRDNSVPVIAALFLEVALSFGGTYFFTAAFSGDKGSTESDELRYDVAVLITASCSVMAFSKLEVFGTVSVGRFFATIIVMCSAMKGGMLSGAAVGTVMGLTMDISHYGAGFYAMAYSFSGFLSGVFGKRGRIIFLLSYILSNALAVACSWDTELYMSALFECFCASVIFMLLPGQWIERAAMLAVSGRGSGETGLRHYVAGRVRELSEAYAALYSTVEENVSEVCNDADVAKIFDRAADEVCIKCRHKNRCWNENFTDTLSAFNDAAPAMQEKGIMEEGDLPQFFREKCVSVQQLVSAVNRELRSAAYRNEMRRHIDEDRSIAWGQYLDMAEILSSVADELGNSGGAEPLAEQRLMRYLRELDIEAETAVYRDASGRMRVIIESERTEPLVSEPQYLEKLSEVVGVRLCRPEGDNADCRITLLEAEPMTVTVGIAAMKKQGESVSGDRGTYFKTDSGVLCIILSDGMGTGAGAAEDSGRVVGILEKFLRSGVDPAHAMKLLNSVMLLRSADKWGYATVDLVCIDLFSGNTCFYKYGAAPSYVKNGKSIKRIKGESLAVGLSTGEGLMPDIVRMRLRPGSTAIIASDGVIADKEDKWIKEILSDGADNMKTLAMNTIKAAEELYGAADDMTVVAICVEERA